LEAGANITVNQILGVAADIPFSPDWDIVSTNTQDAVVEVRDDTDTKLAGKADLVHTHIASQVTDFDSAVTASTQVTANTWQIAINVTDIWNNTTAIAGKLTTVSTDASLSWDGTVWVPLSVNFPWFGTEYQNIEDLSLTSTSSSAVRSIKWSITNTGTAWTYKVWYSSQIQRSVTNNKIEVRVVVGWVSQGDLKAELEPQDPTNRYPFSWEWDITVLNWQTVELEFKKSWWAWTASMRDVRWFIHKIS
jgi:hypothetical protein